MSNPVFTLTLSRWHRVSERIAREINARHELAKTVLGKPEVAEYLGPAQIARLEHQAQKAMTALAEAAELQSTLVEVRAAVSAHNEQLGIGKQVAQSDQRNRRLKLLQEILEPQLDGRISLDELAHVKSPERVENFGRGSHTRIPVRLLNEAQLQQLHAEATALNAAAYQAADQLADCNKATLKLALPSHIARLVGL